MKTPELTPLSLTCRDNCEFSTFDMPFFRCRHPWSWLSRHVESNSWQASVCCNNSLRNYITTKRVMTLQTNACSCIWITQQTVKISNICSPRALGLGRPGAATVGWSNPAPNHGLYFIHIQLVQVHCTIRVTFCSWSNQLQILDSYRSISNIPDSNSYPSLSNDHLIPSICLNHSGFGFAPIPIQWSSIPGPLHFMWHLYTATL